jgi:hypothetical protein
MSILADSLGPSYPFGAPPSLQEDDPMSAAAPLFGLGRPGKDKDARVPEKPSAVRRDETLLPDHPADGAADLLSGLVDFELFERAMQSPEDDDISRNNQAPADLDANVLLSSYQQLLGAQTLSASPPFHPVL